MFAFLGLGLQEILILAILGAMAAGVVVVVLFLSRSATGSSGQTAALEEENRRLREQLDRERERPKE